MSLLSKKPKLQSGFTLAEMVVVVGIFLIMTGVVLSNFKGFTRRSSLDLLAREMSLAIRQAQVYGAATKRYEGVVSTNENRFPSYGAYIAGNNANNFLLFADKDGSGNIKSTTCDKAQECVEQFNLTGGAVIQKVEGYYGSGHEEVKKADGTEWLNIVFQRPRLDSTFTVKCGSSCPTQCTTDYVSNSGVKQCAYTYVKITLADPGETSASSTRDILVWNTGHIYVESELGN